MSKTKANTCQIAFF